MGKEILLYGNIDSMSSTAFITAVSDAADSDISVRVNCNGGNPEYGWGIVAKFSEVKSKKLVKVDGKAYSMGAFFLCYADEVEALDVAEFLIHRAAYSEWYESDANYFTPAIKANLERINQSLRAAFEGKVDVKKFEKIAGVKLDEVFSMDTRIDVYLTAEQAAEIGLISKVIPITPHKSAEIGRLEAAANFEAPKLIKQPEQSAASTQSQSINNNKSKTMTIAEFKANHPDLYASVVAEGVAQEKDRVEAIMVYSEIDPVATKSAIESGKPLSMKQMAELSLKAANKGAVAAIEKEAPEAVKTAEVKTEATAQTEKEKELAAFAAAAKENYSTI